MSTSNEGNACTTPVRVVEVSEEERAHLLAQLHEECGKVDPSFNRIHGILEQDPSLAFGKDKDEKLALHIVCAAERNRSCSTWVDACFFHRPPKVARTTFARDPLYESNGLGESLKVVQLLLELYPKSAQVRDGAGQLPLHLLCFHGAPLVTVDAVLQAFPEALALRSSVDGKLSLHIVCARNTRPEVILYLLKEYPQAIAEQDAMGFTPLHLVSSPAAQADVLDALLSYPQGRQALETPTADTGFLPLHLACRRGASHHTIERLVHACPEAARVADKDQQWLPLHYASARLDPKVVEMLVDIYPESILVKDTCGRLPFQIAYDRNASIDFLKKLVPPDTTLLHFCIENGMDLRFVQSLIIRCPDALSQRDEASGSLPIHCASSLKPSRLDVLELLVNEYPESLLQPNQDGDYPCHLACKSNCSLEVLRLVMPDPTEFAKIPNRQGELALHVACRHGASVQVLDFLHQAHPDGLLAKSKIHGNLPVHDLAGNAATFDQAQYAVQHFPSALQRRNNQGFAPLHLACMGDAPLDSVYTFLRFYPDALTAHFDTNNDHNLDRSSF